MHQSKSISHAFLSLLCSEPVTLRDSGGDSSTLAIASTTVSNEQDTTIIPVKKQRKPRPPVIKVPAKITSPGDTLPKTCGMSAVGKTSITKDELQQLACSSAFSTATSKKGTTGLVGLGPGTNGRKCLYILAPVSSTKTVSSSETNSSSTSSICRGWPSKTGVKLPEFSEIRKPIMTLHHTNTSFNLGNAVTNPSSSAHLQFQSNNGVHNHQQQPFLTRSFSQASINVVNNRSINSSSNYNTASSYGTNSDSDISEPMYSPPPPMGYSFGHFSHPYNNNNSTDNSSTNEMFEECSVLNVSTSPLNGTFSFGSDAAASQDNASTPRFYSNMQHRPDGSSVIYIHIPTKQQQQ
jgi:hypothetical protein